MEKNHEMNKIYLKDVMKCAAEACRREGRKLDVYRVPDNIEEIVARLRREDEGVKVEDVGQGEVIGLTQVIDRIQAPVTMETVSQPIQIIPETVIEELAEIEPGALSTGDNNVVIYSMEGKTDDELGLGNCYILLDVKDNVVTQ